MAAYARSAAEEHPDDRSDRLWQDRDRAAAGEARGRPFHQVEAQFTEVGYVGPHCEQNRSHLVEVAIAQGRNASARTLQARAQLAAEGTRLDRWSAPTPAPPRAFVPQEAARRRAQDKEIEVENNPRQRLSDVRDPGHAGRPDGAISIGDILASSADARRPGGRRSKAPTRSLSRGIDKLLDNDQLIQEAIGAVENNGIVFLRDRQDLRARKPPARRRLAEGVQRDLLPLIEAPPFSTKHGAVKDRHILFIASGAFHIAKPRPVAGVAGRLRDPGRAAASDPRRHAPHPD